VGRRAVGAGGKVHIRVRHRRTARRSVSNVADVRAGRSQQAVASSPRPPSLTRQPSAQLMTSKTPIASAPARPPTPPPPVVRPTRSQVVQRTAAPPVKRQAVRQVVNVDVGLAGATTLPVVVPASFVQRAPPQRSHAHSHELIAVGGIDVENISGDMPGRLQCSYDSANNTWRTMTAQMPDFIHHHGLAAVDGRLFVIGERLVLATWTVSTQLGNNSVVRAHRRSQ